MKLNVEPNPCAAANPAIALRLQTTPFLGPVAGSLAIVRTSMNTTAILSISIGILTVSLTRADERPPNILRSPELAAQPQARTTPEQRQQIIATTRSLEKAPFKLGATTEREKVLWTIDDAPDIFPRLQDRFIPDISSSGVPDWRPIYAQFVFGFVSFQLEQPEKADDAVAVHQGALKSCLQVYRHALERDITNPKRHVSGPRIGCNGSWRTLQTSRPRLAPCSRAFAIVPCG
jgi:hypothetical protein